MIVVSNPELVQAENWRDAAAPAEATPVFLIHDGGGTTFAYHCLGPLGRSVYGIHNPYFRSGQVFNGGLPQMARLYASWVKRTVAARGFPVKRRNGDGTVSVLLGGWSLGGLLSLEVARRLAGDPVVRVVGILMVDSAFPGAAGGADRSLLASAHLLDPASWAAMVQGSKNDINSNNSNKSTINSSEPPRGAGDGPDPCPPDNDDDDGDDGDDGNGDCGSRQNVSAREKNLALSRRCMANAVQMVARWDAPRWDGDLAGSRPRAILLRAKVPVPTPAGAPALGLDRSRGERTLGWDAYAGGMFEEVLDVEGHHFEVFAPRYIDGISEAMRRALDRLDAMARGSG
ncbi:Conidial yellow pigment biosynthesis polyketide synthase [Escovopsis weberi]|uniref:Conidial yellow pigment biosynthesis polyketide synthase n=1 Tax=Escovopsis weberi TaxID=150374 RepID=A0A0M8N222_ESCWE|nr:Conidial yellow pigment biosynthesis polyketide synthase [Escovopsis weberi]